MPPPAAPPAPSGPRAPPEPVAITSFLTPEPRDLLPAGDTDTDDGSSGEGTWPQEPSAFAVELARGPGGFGLRLRGGRELRSGLFVRGLRLGGPAQRCGRIQVSDQLLAINGTPTATMTHAQALARIRGGGNRLRLLLLRPPMETPPQTCHGVHTPPTYSGTPQPPPQVRGVLLLCVSTSPRGELCFCLVGRRDPPTTGW